MPKLREIDFLDQIRINSFDYAVERALEIICLSGEIASEKETRKLISLCVLDQMRFGEDDRNRLVNKSILDFRRRMILNQVQYRQREIQAR